MPITHARRRPTRTVAAAAVALSWAVVGCGTSGGDDARPAETTSAASSSTTGPTTAPRTDDDGCPTTDAIAEVVDVEVERLVHSGGVGDGELAVAFAGCAYVPVDDERDLRVVVARATTEDDLGDERLFDVLEDRAQLDALEDGFAPLAASGVDDAYLDGLQVVLRTAGTMLFVEVDPPGGPAPSDARQSVTLATAVAAFGVDDPADPDCEAFGDLVAELIDDPVDATISGGGIGIDDVSISTSGCGFELADGTEVSIATAPDDQWKAWVEAKESSTFTASYAQLDVAGRAAFDDGESLVIDDGTEGPGDSPHRVEAEDPELGRDEAAALRLAIGELVIDG